MSKDVGTPSPFPTAKLRRLVFAGVLLLGATIRLPAENVLLVTDIHFNPFAACANGAPASVAVRLVQDRHFADWKFSPVPPAGYRQETNATSLDGELAEIRRVVTAGKIRKIFVCGDMLEHAFDADFAKYVQQPDQLAEFSSNVILYLLDRLKTATNGAEIYYVLGNNDSDTGDYHTPTPKFMENLADGLFGPGASEAKTTFEQTGFTSHPLSSSIQIIGLNGNLLTRSLPSPGLARAQLALLRESLAECQRDGKPAILLMHEPFGMDAYTSFRMGRAVSFFDPALEREYVKVLLQYAGDIPAIFAGHCHMEYFGTIAGHIPLFGTLALNSFYGNNPGFKVLKIDDHSGKLLNYTVYYLDIAQPTPQWRTLYHFLATYDPAGRPPAEMINHFPSEMSNPLVQSYRVLCAGRSIHPQPIVHDAAWLYYYAAMTLIDPATYARAVGLGAVKK